MAIARTIIIARKTLKYFGEKEKNKNNEGFKFLRQSHLQCQPQLRLHYHPTKSATLRSFQIF